MTDSTFDKALRQQQMKILAKMGLRPRNSVDFVERQSTGSLALDYLLGGGVGKGRLSIFWGRWRGGKSTVAMMVAREVTRAGGKVAWFDVENSLELDRCLQMGIDMNNFIPFGRPGETGESMLDQAAIMISGTTKERAAAIKAKKDFNVPHYFDLIVWDSAAATPWQRKMEAKAGDRHMAIGATKWTDFFETQTLPLHATKIPFILINQIRSNMDPMSYEKDLMPGGAAMKHAASTILKFTSSKHIKNGKELIAVDMNIKSVKNKLAPEGRECIVRLNIDGQRKIAEVALEPEVIAVGQALGVFTKRGNVPSYDGNSRYFNGINLGENEAAVLKRIIEDEALFNEAYIAVRQAFEADLRVQRERHSEFQIEMDDSEEPEEITEEITEEEVSDM